MIRLRAYLLCGLVFLAAAVASGLGADLWPAVAYGVLGVVCFLVDARKRGSGE